MSIGYIYVRENEYWNSYNAYKLGKTSNIIDRENTYITSEIKRGNYVMIIELDINIFDNIEKQLQMYFNNLNLHIKFNAGIEFYNKEILNYIIPFFDMNNIEYKVLSLVEIENLIGNVKISNNDNIQYINDQIETIIPRGYQELIINKSCNYYENNAKGLLVIPCGVGKTLISLWITQRLNLNTILIGVPNKLLLQQWKKVIGIIFKDTPYLIISDGIDNKIIIQFLEKNQKNCIIITTYASAYKIYTITKKLSFIFEMKINDECHHLTTNNIELAYNAKKYIQMLTIASVKQLSLTATLKHLENVYEDDFIVSNDNIKYFGEIIDRKCLLWAINENIICDYIIQTIITDENKIEQQLSIFNIIDENDIRLFLSAFAALKSISDGFSHHLLIYSNNKNNSQKIIRYIKILLDNNYFDIIDIFYSNYHSEMKPKTQNEILNIYNKSKFGIITSIYCLSEGFDNNIIDAVVFAENMSSNIRIVQSALRASRKNNLQPDKITKIILSILNINGDWLDNNNSDFKKVREVIYQMSLEDETITQKIKVFKVNIEKQNTKIIKKELNKIVEELNNYNEELTQKLRLKTTKRIALNITYDKAKKIIVDNNIKNKKEYYELCEKDDRLSMEPEVIFKKEFISWIEYLSIERIYYDLETCKSKICGYLLLYPELKQHHLNLSIVCKKLCKLDPLFPPNDLWIEYYNVKDLQDIIIIVNKKKKLEFIL